MEERDRWIELIKGLRAEHGCSLDDAHRLAWAMPEWRRWVERQINTDPKCRKRALHHIRHQGAAALLEDRLGRLSVRQQLPQGTAA